MTATIDNPEHYAYVCERNARIDAWRKRQARLRYAKARRVRAQQVLERARWDQDREEARERLFEAMDRAERSGELRATQTEQIALLRTYLTRGGWGCGLSEEVGITRALFDKRIQRARKLCQRYGATDEDLKKWSNGWAKMRPEVEPLRTLASKVEIEEE